MTKKLLIVFILVAFFAVGAFAQSGVGGGVYFNNLRASAVNTVNSPSYGAFGFFDSKFYEVTAGVAFNPDFEILIYNFTTHLKFPFQITNNIAVFPAIGLNMLMDRGGRDLFAEGGLGLDFSFTEKLFLRTTGTYGFYLGDKPAELSLHLMTVRMGIGFRL